MALRPEFSLGHSVFNEFLFAFVGEEKSGVQLTVLSALARIGVDPWGEAARLSDLPRATATVSLASTIGALPEGDWKASDSESIADRLVKYLPKHGSLSEEFPEEKRIGDQKRMSRAAKWLALVSAVAFVMLRL